MTLFEIFNKGFERGISDAQKFFTLDVSKPDEFDEHIYITNFFHQAMFAVNANTAGAYVSGYAEAFHLAKDYCMHGKVCKADHSKELERIKNMNVPAYINFTNHSNYSKVFNNQNTKPC